MFVGRAVAGEIHKDTSVILVFLNGGPSQLETYDLKPDVPSSYRSVFKPIETNVPGVAICELFPLQAKLADKFSLVRSLHHDLDSHSDSGIIVLTGKRPRKLDPTSRSKSEHPDFSSIASKVHGMTQSAYLSLHHRAFERSRQLGPDSPHCRILEGL